MEVNKEFNEKTKTENEVIRDPVTVTIIEPYNKNKSLKYLKITKRCD